MKRYSACLASVALLVPFLSARAVLSDSVPAVTKVREVPARSIPAPTTVSPELKKQAVVPVESLTAIESVNPSTAEDWQRIIDGANKSMAAEIEKLQQKYPAAIAAKTVAGVKTVS